LCQGCPVSRVDEDSRGQIERSDVTHGLDEIFRTVVMEGGVEWIGSIFSAARSSV
jgi:hypothetical protein